MIRFALQSERLGPKLVQNSKVLQTFDLEFTPPTAGRPGNTPSCRKMVRKIHSKLPLQPAESKMGECRKANSVFDKALGILGQAELFEPVRDLLHGRHQRSRCGMTEFSTTAIESLYQYGGDSTPLTATFGVACCRFQSSLGISISAFDRTAQSKSMLSALRA